MQKMQSATISSCLSFQEDTPPAKAAAPVKKKAKAAKDVDVSAAKGSSTIFVKNLAWAVDQDQLYEFFASCGEVVDARIGEPHWVCCSAQTSCHALSIVCKLATALLSLHLPVPACVTSTSMAAGIKSSLPQNQTSAHAWAHDCRHASKPSGIEGTL